MEKWEKLLMYSEIYNAEIYNFEEDRFYEFTVCAKNDIDAYEKVIEKIDSEKEEIYNLY